MSVLLQPKSEKKDIMISTTQSGDVVYIQAHLPGAAYSWSLGFFKQDSDGALYFERAGGIGKSEGYPSVLLDGSSGKIKVT